MATRQEAQEYIIDLILNFIITNATKYLVDDESFHAIDLNQYRRYIDPSTGQITVGQTSSDSNLILYEKDFRESFDDTLIDAVKNIIDNCVVLDNEISDYTSDEWVYIEGNSGCDDFPSNFGGISFSGSDENQLDGTGCAFYSGTMGCGDHSISLSLTEEVLYSLSQFIPILQQQTDIDEDLAKEILDTNIYELIPSGVSRQEQIDKFFSDYSNLKGDSPNETEWPWDLNYDEETGDEINDHWSTPGHDDAYTEDHDISDLNPLGFIPRLDEDVVGTVNVGQTLQSLRDDLDNFLLDVDTPMDTETVDDRPDYQNQSGGYLKFRGLNQAIIVRSTEGTDVGLKDYRVDGFTITMWVRFLDKVSEGTLFNYGNPLRDDNPTGFMLDTLIDTDIDSENRYIRLVLRDGGSALNDSNGLDTDNNLRDSHVGTAITPRYDTATNNQTAYDSDLDYLENYTSVPIDFSEWFFIVASFNPDIREEDSFIDYTQAGDLAPDGTTPLSNSPEFWRNNIIPGILTGTCSNPIYPDESSCTEASSCVGVDSDGDGTPDEEQPTDEATCLDPSVDGSGAGAGEWILDGNTWDSTASGTGTWTDSSNYGAMCKVEVISKSDLLRARGFQV